MGSCHSWSREPAEPRPALAPRRGILELVERCALAKRRLVLLDERDVTGVRMALNLGHTLSHALEAATSYRLRHGEAVAYGLRVALDIGVSIGATPTAIASRGHRLLDGLGLATLPLDVPVMDVLAYLEADKKRRDGQTRGCSSAASTGSRSAVTSRAAGAGDRGVGRGWSPLADGLPAHGCARTPGTAPWSRSRLTQVDAHQLQAIPSQARCPPSIALCARHDRPRK